ncbi:DUF262 domain-containing protein [Burkholderia sp. BCC1638]|uniref:DUF262 domain-containing protein n=1 Tax=Burkholderia sp. BCC1638 TaxID=2681391 RepID=UPI00158B7C73|nr:DUF262 domain-containing protein [Burkholderia sp. BCC1638]
MKTSPSSLKIRQIITQMKAASLIPRPEFQRRLVWTSADKVRFIDTILKGYPFPEIYVANGETNVDTGEGTQLLVDGQQRVTTIFEYFHGDPSTYDVSIPSYAQLAKEQKEEFLNYDVAVRDLGPVNYDQIIEVFKRINSTKYSLNDIEINNAVYAGELMRFAAGFAEHDFFDNHKVFRAADIKRMGDVRFVLQVLITMMDGYFNRDEPFESYLIRFNDHFPDRDFYSNRMIDLFSYIDECGFSPKSRLWKRSDLFTGLIEIDRALANGTIPSPLETVARLQNFYSEVDDRGLDTENRAVSLYAKAAIQASNDRLNRVRRGVIIDSVLCGHDPNTALIQQGLLDPA